MDAAHPRSRGEHIIIKQSLPSSRGSSPLARGTSHNRILANLSRRLIPARAGNMPSNRSSWKRLTAHPRSRGEHVHGDLQTTDATGSSPLARGTLTLFSFQALTNRLIPARAGNIVWGESGGCSGSAHPRSRGEHLSWSRYSTAFAGSSPLARGTYLCS